MTIPYCCRPVGLLLVLTTLLTILVNAKEDRVPTCEEINQYYDDDTVYCNQADYYDYSYNLDKLDPNQAPMRCEDWDVSEKDLDVWDPLFICQQWHLLYGELRPTSAPTTRAPTSLPTRVPTAAPTSLPTSMPPTTAQNDSSPPTTTIQAQTESIALHEFSLRIVVPTSVRRKLRAGGGVPYNQLEFTMLTESHIYNYLESELNRNVSSVNLRILHSQVTSIQGSTVVTEALGGSVEFDMIETKASPKTVNSLALQSLEGQALWEFFFSLRGANDAYLRKTQQVTLVDSSSSNTTTSSSKTSTFSTGVIATLVIIGLVTACIIGYFGFWIHKQKSNYDDNTKKREATPDTQSSGTFFAETPSPNNNNNRSFRHKQQMEETSVSNLSFVSSVNSALHSIRERSLEDEEEEPDDSESSNWDDDDSEIQKQVVVNMPPLNYSNGDEVTIVEQDYGSGQIHRIMPLETSYCTSNGTEVTRHNNIPKSKPAEKPTTEKPANRWLMWKISKGRQLKKNVAVKQRQAVEQKAKEEQQALDDSYLEPPSMVDMSLPSQQQEMSGLDDTLLDPPSRIMDDEEEPSSFQSDTLAGESIEVSEFSLD